MGSFQLTNKAKRDLKSIAAHTQKKWGKEQRRIYLRQFDEAFHVLSGTPGLGIACDYIRAGYRKFPVVSHIVFYRLLSESHIEIVRVLHKRMDVRPVFIEP